MIRKQSLLCLDLHNCDLSGLSVNVDENIITQSSKVRDLGVIFDQFLNFDDHITTICRSIHFHIRNIGKIRNLLSYNAYYITFLRIKLIASLNEETIICVNSVKHLGNISSFNKLYFIYASVKPCILSKLLKSFCTSYYGSSL